MPGAWSFWGKIRWETQSNAFWKSMKIIPIDFPWFKALRQFSVMLSNRSSVDFPFVNPHCESDANLKSRKKESSWEQTTLSSSLLGMLSNEIGR